MDQWWPSKAPLTSICCLPRPFVCFHPLFLKPGALVWWTRTLSVFSFPLTPAQRAFHCYLVSWHVLIYFHFNPLLLQKQRAEWFSICQHTNELLERGWESLVLQATYPMALVSKHLGGWWQSLTKDSMPKGLPGEQILTEKNTNLCLSPAFKWKSIIWNHWSLWLLAKNIFVFFGHDTEEDCVNACVWDGWVGDSVCSLYIPGPTECLDTCVPGTNQASRLCDLARCMQGSVPRIAARHRERQGPVWCLMTICCPFPGGGNQATGK